MTETKGDAAKPSTLAEGGATETRRTPAWKVKYDWSIDDQPCPDDDEIDRIVDERTV